MQRLDYNISTVSHVPTFFPFFKLLALLISYFSDRFDGSETLVIKELVEEGDFFFA